MPPGIWKKIYKVATILVVAATLVLSVYIMAHKLGLSDSLDFGAGAYYYADIPNFEEIIPDTPVRTGPPLWVYIVLFLGWGYLMYRLWVWIDKK